MSFPFFYFLLCNRISEKDFLLVEYVQNEYFQDVFDESKHNEEGPTHQKKEQLGISMRDHDLINTQLQRFVSLVICLLFKEGFNLFLNLCVCERLLCVFKLRIVGPRRNLHVGEVSENVVVQIIH